MKPDKVLKKLKKFLRIGLKEMRNWEKEYAQEQDYRWALRCLHDGNNYKYVLDKIKELEDEK